MAGKKRSLMCLAAAVLLLGLAVTLGGARRERTADFDEKLEAAQLMQQWMDVVAEQKCRLGLPLDGEDLHATGLVGEAYTPITTTHGESAAKRTTCDPDMAALAVKLLRQAGVRPGDTVGAGFSGSFPGLNLAVLAACQTLDVKCVYIASVGSSTYGANQPQATFPDMLHWLLEEGGLERAPSLVTPGGGSDCGTDMDQALLEEILARLEGYGMPLLREPDFESNLAARMAVYEEEGPIRCFIGVGGNLSTLGREGSAVDCGVIPPGELSAGPDSGLLQRYNAQGLPVVHLLNIKRLLAEHDMTFDPERLSPPGESAVYYETVYPKWAAALSLMGAGLILWLGFRRLRRTD